MTPVARRARPATRRALATVTALAIVATAATGSALAATDGAATGSRTTALAAASGPTKVLPERWRHEMLTRVNALRADAGVPPLRPCPSLRRAAQQYAMVMADTNSFGHVGPDGAQPWDRMRAQGFSWQVASENIASGQTSVEQVLREWLASPGHAANLMDVRVLYVGLGFAVDARARTYWVQDFGRGTGC